MGTSELPRMTQWEMVPGISRGLHFIAGTPPQPDPGIPLAVGKMAYTPPPHFPAKITAKRQATRVVYRKLQLEANGTTFWFVQMENLQDKRISEKVVPFS